jgi:hypothetical protein
MEVDAVCIPAAQMVKGKSVAQVIGSRPYTTAFGLQSGQLE